MHNEVTKVTEAINRLETARFEARAARLMVEQAKAKSSSSDSEEEKAKLKLLAEKAEELAAAAAAAEVTARKILNVALNAPRSLSDSDFGQLFSLAPKIGSTRLVRRAFRRSTTDRWLEWRRCKKARRARQRKGRRARQLATIQAELERRTVGNETRRKEKEAKRLLHLGA